MRPIHATLLLIIVLFIGAISVTNGQSAAPLASNVYATAYRTTHQIFESTIVESTRACSATAIAPHAILTASHCELPTSALAITLDGSNTVMEIQGIIRDGYDHTIYELSGTFKNYAEFSSARITVGDDIFLFGNPGELEDILRKGYVAKAPLQDATPFQRLFLGPLADQVTYDFNGFFGDSGAAIFNQQGEITGVVSQINSQSEPKAAGAVSQNLMLGYTLHFTADQLKHAESFVPHKVETDLEE
jgi:hypothetical protein